METPQRPVDEAQVGQEAANTASPPPEAGPAPAGDRQAARSSKSKRAGLVVGVVAALGVLAVKFVLPLVLVSVAGQALEAVFGGPYARLPSDVRDGFERRIEAAVGDQLEGLSDEEQSTQVQALIKAGLPRLDDATLETRYRIAGRAFDRADTATCAILARAVFTGTEPSDNSNTKVIGALDDTDLRRWFEISVQAMEAEARGAPAATTVTDAAVEPLWEGVGSALSATDLAALVSIGNGETVDDASACSALRELYRATLGLPPAQVTLFARYDVSP